MGTHETKRDYWRLLRPMKTHETQRPTETHETNGDQWRLVKLRETNGDSCDSERRMWTHETQRD